MSGFAIFVTTVTCVLVLMMAWHLYITIKRKIIMSHPTNPEWEVILQNNIAVYKHLPTDLKQQLCNLMKVFIAEKNFEGCGGLEMTQEIKVTVAGEACVLMLNRRPSFYPNLDSILLYPSSYFAKDVEYLSYGTYVTHDSFRMGESWKHGIVVLAWDHVKKGALDMDDGHNVVLHEFAHQLDEEDQRYADGVPLLKRPSSYVTWARVFSKEFSKLKRDTSRNKETVIDEYGTTNPAEFFAVATESFFEKPKQLKQHHPALYKELKEYYNLDPVEWII